MCLAAQWKVMILLLVLNSDTVMFLGVVFFRFSCLAFIGLVESVPWCLSLLLEKVSAIIPLDVTSLLRSENACI